MDSGLRALDQDGAAGAGVEGRLAVLYYRRGAVVGVGDDEGALS